MVVHSRQCVGRKSVHLLLSALIHPPRARRHGKVTARTPVSSMTASSRSRSNGAVDTGCHIVSHQDVGQRPCGAVRTSRWVAARYSALSAELKFGNSQFGACKFFRCVTLRSCAAKLAWQRLRRSRCCRCRMAGSTRRRSESMLCLLMFSATAPSGRLVTVAPTGGGITL